MKLGKTTQKVYDFIKAYIVENHYPPTYREIGDGIGLRSTNTVWHHVHYLHEIGLIDMECYKSRNIVVVDIEEKKFGNSEQVNVSECPTVWKEQLMKKFMKGAG